MKRKASGLGKFSQAGYRVIGSQRYTGCFAGNWIHEMQEQETKSKEERTPETNVFKAEVPQYKIWR